MLSHYFGKGVFSVPREITKEERRITVTDCANATLRYVEAGFNGGEIRGAKGYLLDKFLTDFANAKEDEYGGTIQNHIRFHCEVLESVLEVVGGKIKFSYCILKFFYIFTSQSSSALFLFF